MHTVVVIKRAVLVFQTNFSQFYYPKIIFNIFPADDQCLKFLLDLTIMTLLYLLLSQKFLVLLMKLLFHKPGHALEIN